MLSSTQWFNRIIGALPHLLFFMIDLIHFLFRMKSPYRAFGIEPAVRLKYRIITAWIILVCVSTAVLFFFTKSFLILENHQQVF